jgi:hypothetical protein
MFNRTFSLDNKTQVEKRNQVNLLVNKVMNSETDEQIHENLNNLFGIKDLSSLRT